jgi:hypothetical protein
MMTRSTRELLVRFCVEATAEIHGISKEEVDENEFKKLDDEKLQSEADWLDDMLNK